MPETCPTCGRTDKVYRRKISPSTAAGLVTMYQTAGRGWVYLPDILGASGGDIAKARYWDLIEQCVSPSGRPYAGTWQLTPLGVAWILDRAVVPKYAYVSRGRLLDLDDTYLVSIRHCLPGYDRTVVHPPLPSTAKEG